MTYLYNPFDKEWATETVELLRNDESPDEVWARMDAVLGAIINGALVPPYRPPENHFSITLNIPHGNYEVQVMIAMVEVLNNLGEDLSSDAKLRVAEWFLSWAKEQVRKTQEYGA